MDYVNLIKNKVLLSSIVSRVVKLQKRGVNFIGLCPFHHEKTPSFTVNDEQGFYYCFGCGAHGDILQFVIDNEKVNFKDALKGLADIAGITLPEKHEGIGYDPIIRILELTAKWFYEELKVSKPAIEYLKKRYFTADIINKFKIGYAPNYGLQQYLIKHNINYEMMLKAGVIKESYGKKYDYFRNRIIFPIMNLNGKIIAFGGRSIIAEQQPKYLNSAESILFKKKDNLYGLHLALKSIRLSNKIIVVEGYTDVIAFHAIGISNVVAPLGTAITVNLLQKLWELASEILICMDGDEAGNMAAIKVAIMALPVLEVGKVIRFVNLPKGKDPYDVCYDLNYDIKSIVNSAQLHSDFLWEYALKESKLENEQYANPEKYIQLENILSTFSKEIKDYNIAKHYKKFFYQKVNSVSNNALFISKKKKVNNSNSALHKGVDDMEYNNLIIIRIAIELPEMLNNAVLFEYFAHLNIVRTEISLLQQQIVNLKSIYNEKLSSELLISKLNEYKLDNYLNFIYQNTKSLDNYFINKNKKAVLNVWKNIMLLSQLKELQLEIADLRIRGEFACAEKLSKQVEIIDEELKNLWDEQCN